MFEADIYLLFPISSTAFILLVSMNVRCTLTMTPVGLVNYLYEEIPNLIIKRNINNKNNEKILLH